MSEALTRADTYIESLIGWLPGPAQSVVQRVINPAVQVLYEVTGDPDDLMRAAQVWTDTATQVDTVANTADQDASTVVGSWEGEASAAFTTVMEQVTAALRDLAEGVRSTSDVLVAAAGAAVEAFNLIIELIGEFVLWAGAKWVLAIAASVFSLGASLAAATVSTIASAVKVVGQVSSVAARLAVQLKRLADLIRRIGELVKAYRGWILALKAVKANSSRLAYMAIKTIRLTPGLLVFNAISPINIPGLVGAGSDLYGGYQDVQDGSVDDDYLADSRTGG